MIKRPSNSPIDNKLPVDMSEARGQLIKLLTCFTRWPPLRAELIDPVSLEPSPVTTPETTLASNAGGLVLWAVLLEATDLLPQLSGVCAPRTCSAVLWALARSLESPSLDARDPLLLRWCGEPASSRLAPTQVLNAAEPELVHRVALCSLPVSAWELQVMPWGAGWVALRGGVVVDFSLEGAPDDALPGIVQRLRGRTQQEPTSIELLEAPNELARCALEALDLPTLPDAWRPASLALASVLRLQLMTQFGVDLKACRGWEAHLTETCVELRTRDVSRVGGGSWLPKRVASFGLGGGAALRVV